MHSGGISSQTNFEAMALQTIWVSRKFWGFSWPRICLKFFEQISIDWFMVHYNAGSCRVGNGHEKSRPFCTGHLPNNRSLRTVLSYMHTLQYFVVCVHSVPDPMVTFCVIIYYKYYSINGGSGNVAPGRSGNTRLVVTEGRVWKK
jgi:hypothetical protein